MKTPLDGTLLLGAGGGAIAGLILAVLGFSSRQFAVGAIGVICALVGATVFLMLRRRRHSAAVPPATSD